MLACPKMEILNWCSLFLLISAPKQCLDYHSTMASSRFWGVLYFLEKTPPTIINSCEVQNLCNVFNNLPNLCKRFTFVLCAPNSCSPWYPSKLISIPIHIHPIHVVNDDVQMMVPPPQAPLLVICQLFHKCTQLIPTLL